MGGTKGIAYVQISQISQLLAELLAVLGLLLAAETGILEQHHVALLHSLHSLGGGFAGDIVVGYEHHFLAQLLGQPLRHRRQGLLLVGAFLHLA